MSTVSIALPSDAEEILALYHTMIGGPAGWSEDYPNLEIVRADIARQELFVRKSDSGAIEAVIAIDHEEEVDALKCWSAELQPQGFLSRLCVRSDLQGQGIAGQMLDYAFAALKKRGMAGVRMLVRKGHQRALGMYLHRGFQVVGECELFDDGHFVCIEKAL